MLTLTACSKGYAPSTSLAIELNMSRENRWKFRRGYHSDSRRISWMALVLLEQRASAVHVPFLSRLPLFLGVFRIACEITMGLLRENKDTLMTVLDPFIHDPLVEWEDEKRKIVSRILEDMTKLSRRIATGTTITSAACP